MSIGGEAKPLSYDHKPVNKTENSRIVAAGGFVEFGRVNGNLALSRALGDFEFKQNQNLPAEQQIVTADPDIISHTSTAEDEFLVIACDGIWDVLKNQEVVDFVRRCIAQRKELHEICELMMDKCLAPDSDWGGVGCDNMTVMLVALLNGKTKEEWYDWMVERVEKNVGYTTYVWGLFLAGDVTKSTLLQSPKSARSVCESRSIRWSWWPPRRTFVRTCAIHHQCYQQRLSPL